MDNTDNANNTNNTDNTNNAGNSGNGGLVRGPVPFEENDNAEARPEITKDFRKPEFRDTKPDLEAHHDDILKDLQNGVSLRVIHTKLGVTRRMVRTFIDKYDDLKEAWADSKEDYLDLNEEIVNEIATMDCRMVPTENGMFPAVDGRSLATKFNAAKFRLERLGGHRGWNAKLETNEVGNGRVPCIFVGDVSEADVANAEAQVASANEAALEGLDGIPHG